MTQKQVFFEQPTEDQWASLMAYVGGIKRRLVGSKYTLGEGNDTDMLILVDDMSGAVEWLFRKGWTSESDEPYTKLGCFMSFRARDLNVLITEDPAFYQKFLTAAEVCKQLKLADRKDRVAVHQIILYGRDAQ